MLSTSTPHPTTQHLKASPSQAQLIHSTLELLESIPCNCRRCMESNSLAIVPWRPQQMDEDADEDGTFVFKSL